MHRAASDGCACVQWMTFLTCLPIQFSWYGWGLELPVALEALGD
jgi:hypothetical protein